MKDSPAVLNRGRRCYHEGWAFYGDAYHVPYVTLPSGKRVDCLVAADVSYQPHRLAHAVATPAVNSVPRIHYAPGGPRRSTVLATSGGDAPVRDKGASRAAVLGPAPCSAYPEAQAEGTADGASDEELSYDARRDPMADLTGCKHSPTHVPKNTHSQACRVANVANKHDRTRKRPISPIPTKFGDQVTADHIVASRDDRQWYDGSNHAIVVYDLGTYVRDCIPKCDKDAVDAILALQHFVGPRQAAQSCHCDGANEPFNGAIDICLCHCTSIS